MTNKKFKIEVWREIDLEDEVLDLEFYLYVNNKKYFGWAFTLKAISLNMKKNQKSLENVGGLYFWATNMIIMDKITYDALYKVIEDILYNSPEMLEDFFERCD